MSPQAIAHSGGQFENELEQLWSNEAVLRLDELHNAVVDGIDAAEVFKNARQEPSR